MNRVKQDPCTMSSAQQSLVVSYCKFCIEGKNIRHKDSIRAETVAGYMREVNELFKKRNLPLPVNFKDRKDKVNILISNLKAEEDIANQRSPFTPQMVAKFISRGKATGHLTLEALCMDVIMSGGRQGYRASETTTTRRTKPDYFEYPGSKKRVIKAMCADWWTAYDGNNDTMDDFLQRKAAVEKMKIHWKFQKNRRNNEPVTHTRSETDPDFCIVERTLSMIERARKLGQPDHLPLCVYRDAKGQMKYLTSTDLTNYIREVARAVHPNMPKSEWMKFSCHSIRVWACVLLSESGRNGDYIKKRLRWLSDCYRIYLRDTDTMANKHNKCLEGYALFVKNMMTIDLPENVDYMVEEDKEMGDYDDPDG